MATAVTDSITCPKCGAQIPLTDAIEHQVEEQLRAQLAGELKERDAHAWPESVRQHGFVVTDHHVEITGLCAADRGGTQFRA
jgi:hypothetical protein